MNETLLFEGHWSDAVVSWNSARGGDGHVIMLSSEFWQRALASKTTVSQPMIPDDATIEAARRLYTADWPKSAQTVRRNRVTGRMEGRQSVASAMRDLGNGGGQAVVVRFDGPLREIPVRLGHGSYGEVPLGSVPQGRLWEQLAKLGLNPARLDGHTLYLWGSETPPEFDVALEVASLLSACGASHPQDFGGLLTAIAGSPLCVLRWG